MPQDDDYVDILVDKGALDLNVFFKAASDLRSGWWIIAITGLIGILLG